MRVVLLSMAAIIVAGCSTPSIGPLYSDDVTVRDDAYLGVWTDEEGKATYSVSRGAGGTYQVAMEMAEEGEEPVSLRLEVVVVELDGRRYADVYPAQSSRDEIGGRYGTLFLPVHNVVRLSREGGELVVEMLDIDWTKRQAGQAGVSMARPDELPVLTGDPAALQALVRRAEAAADGFSDDALRLVRRPADNEGDR